MPDYNLPGYVPLLVLFLTETSQPCQSDYSAYCCSCPQMLSKCHQHVAHVPSQARLRADQVFQSGLSTGANHTGSTLKRCCATGLGLPSAEIAAAGAKHTRKAADFGVPCKSRLGRQQRMTRHVVGMAQAMVKAQKPLKANGQC